MKYWSFVISLLIVVALNANLFDIYADFNTNKTLCDMSIAMGERLVSVPRDSIIIKTDTSKNAQAKADSLIAADMKKNAQKITSLVNEQSFQVMGWTEARMEKYHKLPFLNCVIHLLLGWMGMTLLVSLGAPFWYDLLKAVMGFKDSFKKNTV
jgi:capsular polysaccharide biosynthesis protein